jgi:hypothetical protein
LRDNDATTRADIPFANKERRTLSSEIDGGILAVVNLPRNLARK